MSNNRAEMFTLGKFDYLPDVVYVNYRQVNSLEQKPKGTVQIPKANHPLCLFLQNISAAAFSVDLNICSNHQSLIKCDNAFEI